jgi:hypothetical protein
MNSIKTTLTLDQPVRYEIQVSGHVREDWSEWYGVTTTLRGDREAGPPASVITGTLDQAALHGLLRRLYSLGFPLLSVSCLEITAGGRKEE